MEALIIIDIQKAYFKTDGLLERKDTLVANVNSLIAIHRQRGDLIINFRTIHSPNKNTWTLNMLEDNQGFAFEGSEEIKPLPGLQLGDAIEMTKTRDSAFEGTALLQTLRDRDVSVITLAGVSTHSCIFLTAAQAYSYNITTRIARDAVDDEDQALQRHALDYLHREYRQAIV